MHRYRFRDRYRYRVDPTSIYYIILYYPICPKGAKIYHLVLDVCSGMPKMPGISWDFAIGPFDQARLQCGL